jgi:transcriptional/translational regulatory protein YebC/TACO1
MRGAAAAAAPMAAFPRGIVGGRPAAAVAAPAGRTLLPPAAPRSTEQQTRPFRGTPPCQMGRRAAKIANRKGKADAIKAKLYGRIGKMIVQTVKSGGGADPATNSKLAEVLKKAKDVGAPKDLIERNLKRASDSKQADYAELVYEALSFVVVWGVCLFVLVPLFPSSSSHPPLTRAPPKNPGKKNHKNQNNSYGPGGTGFVVEVLTDNVNRSASDVRAAITKGGGKVAEPGSVSFQFSRQGLAAVVAPADQEDAVFEAAMEAGAEDVVADEPAEDGDPHRFLVYTPVSGYASAVAALKGAGLEVDETSSGLVYKPSATVEVDDAAREACEALAERLLALDDVEQVYSTCEGFN